MFHWLEQRPFFFTVVLFLFISFAGLVEVLPDFAKASQPKVGTKNDSTVKTRADVDVRQVLLEF